MMPLPLCRLPLVAKKFHGAEALQKLTFSDIRRLWEVHVVHMIDHVLRRDHPAAEVTSVETADCVLAALATVELNVDLAVVILETQTDVDDVAVLVLAFGADIIFQLLLPAFLSLSVSTSVSLHNH